MIEYIFSSIPDGTGKSLFSDDGAPWTRGRNFQYIVKRMQEGISKGERWGIKWGFKFSSEKTKFFTRKRVGESNLQTYESVFERVESFPSLLFTLIRD